jgi:hypothetical protein
VDFAPLVLSLGLYSLTMARNKKACKKAKAAPKKKVAQLSCKKHQQELGLEEAQRESVAEETPSKRRRLFRRDAEEAVERLVVTRFAKTVPPEVLGGRRNQKGQSIRQFLPDEVRRKRKLNGRIRSKFWSSLRQEFELDCSSADLLPEAEEMEADDMDKEVLERLNLINHENPAARKTEPFIQYIGVCEEFSYAKLVLVLRAIQEGAVVMKKSATKLSLAVLVYIARTVVSTATEHSEELFVFPIVFCCVLVGMCMRAGRWLVR